MSQAALIVQAVVALNGGDPSIPIHRDRLRELTAGKYAATGANGALFGFRYPWMVKDGDMRLLTDHGRRRLGI